MAEKDLSATAGTEISNVSRHTNASWYSEASTYARGSMARLYPSPSKFPRGVWRASVGCMCLESVFTMVLMGMIFSVGTDYSDASIMGSPLADPDTGTPIGWSYAVVSFVALPFAWFMLVFRCVCGLCPKEGRFRSYARDVHTLPAQSCCLALYAIILFLHLPFVLMYVSWAPCIRGFPGWASGGICICDQRDPLYLEGSPRFAVGGLVPPGLKIAYIGDTDITNVAGIYELIRAENVSAVVTNGDLDYTASPTAWSDMYREALGELPSYATVGNHDTHVWRDYQDEIGRRYLRSNVTECSGNVGVKEVCTHSGVGMLLSGSGSTCGGLTSEHAVFTRETLQQFTEEGVIWRVCNFHKNNYLLHTTQMPSIMKKVDEVGVENFQLCLEHGAMIFTSHKHQYSRTHELDYIDVESVRVSREVPVGSNSSNPIHVGQGKSFVVVNGLGGYSLHDIDPSLAANDWWAIDWAAGGRGVTSPAVAAGAFFCEYHVLGDPRLARCYFKDVGGVTRDEFYVRSES